ncbi:hypothetical protein BCR44DRAFT_1495254 [Catenaria anguillulae PL171]|uniref:Threonine/serine exporter-like N-terminal domain-containing protein n=1 Tax=Catenaria anguillulae PL171 TaxID=765915 RepID=A0A1Y2I1K2_9FUNG|nr:hypothetical protein BCR44DRAFT_1495254 [Catenaria anguillulae PL171]
MAQAYELLTLSDAANDEPPVSPGKVWEVHLSREHVVAAQSLVCKLCKALYLSGAPLYAVEGRAEAISAAIGLPLTIVALPGSLFFAFGCSDELDLWPNTFIIHGNQGNNLYRMQRLDQLAKTLAGAQRDVAALASIRQRLLKAMGEQDDPPAGSKSGTLAQPTNRQRRGSMKHSNPQSASHSAYNSVWSLSASTHIRNATDLNLANMWRPLPTLSLSSFQLQAYEAELDAILATGDFSTPRMRVLCQATASMLLAVAITPVTFQDMAFTWLMGLLHGYLLHIEAGLEMRSGSMDVVIPLIIGFFGRLTEISLTPDTVCFATIAMMPLFTYFPAMPLYAVTCHLTLAMLEISAHKIVTGTVRMLESFMRIVKLGFGMIIGAGIASAILTGHATGGSTICINANRQGTLELRSYPLLMPFALVPCALSVFVLQRTHPCQWPWMLVTSAIGYLSLLLLESIGMERSMSSAFTAMIVSGTSQYLAKKRNHLGLATLNSGLFWLFPGSTYVRGALELLTDNIESCLTFAGDAITRSLSIVLGLYVARVFFAAMWKRKGRLADLGA